MHGGGGAGGGFGGGVGGESKDPWEVSVEIRAADNPSVFTIIENLLVESAF